MEIRNWKLENRNSIILSTVNCQLSTILIVAALLLFQTHTFSQNYAISNVDSVKALTESNDLEIKAENLARLAIHYATTKIDTSISRIYADQALKLANENDLMYVRALSLMAKGSLETKKGNAKFALNYFLDAENDLIQYEDYLMLGHLYTEICYLYIFTDNSHEGFKYMHKMLEAYNKAGNKLYYAFGLWVKGWVEDVINNNNSLSIKIYMEVLKSMDSLNAASRVRSAIRVNLGLTLAELGEIDSAFILLREALDILNENNDYDCVHKCEFYGYMSQLTYRVGDYDQSIKYADSAIQKSKKYGYLWAPAIATNVKAKILSRKGDLDNANHQAKKALNYCQMIDSMGSMFSYPESRHLPSLLWELDARRMSADEYRWYAIGNILYRSQDLSELYKLSGKLDSSLYYLRQYTAEKKRYNNLQKQKDIVSLEMRYETERKELQLANLNRDIELQEAKIDQTRYTYLGLGGVAILIVLFSILLYSQIKLRSQQKSNYLEQRILQMQINPHFIFNALSNIQSLVYHNANKQATSFLSHFAGLLSSILESSRSEFATISHEVSSLKDYLELQKLRFENKFNYKIEIDKDIEPDSLLIPPMLAQPFVENAVEHGIKYRDRGEGQITIRLTINDKQNNGYLILIEIEDNGVGRKKARELDRATKRNHKSLSTTIIREQIAILSKRYKTETVFEIKDLYDDNGEGCGTRVLMGLPCFPVHSTQ